MISKEFLIDNINNIKSKIAKYVARGDHECALRYIYLTAQILYRTNLYYVDEELEACLRKISKEIVLVPDVYIGLDDCLLYWDGVGHNVRGLTQIYLKGLCRCKKVIYVTYEDKSTCIPDVLEILKCNGGTFAFIKRGDKTAEIEQLNLLVKEYHPRHFFLYAFPDDVTATSIMYAYQGKMTRYQVNMTDHAFWLGAGCLDKCIEFREYGASISVEYRNIPEEKIVCLPYYPVYDSEKEFQGYPFPFEPVKQKLIFSGGALYKTFDEGDTYYRIVEYILATYSETVFWYAGTGDSSKIREIIKKYPNRAFLTKEREDLFQVLEHCRFYLNTYPVWGGLMTQYAAIAGKVPVSLGHTNYTADLLMEQDELGIQFNDVGSLKAEIDRLINDDCYLDDKGERLKKSVISAGQFNAYLADIVAGNTDGISIEFKHEDTADFQKRYLLRITEGEFYSWFVKRDIKMDMRIVCDFPVQFILGVMHRIFIQLKK